MKAFHNDPKIKEKYLARLEAHVKADELIHGIYWQDGKGCAVGCTVHSNNHMAYEDELGIPVILARLEDGIFENLSNGLSKEWPMRFLSSIKVGADLSNVGNKFLLWLLIDPKDGVIQFADAKTKPCIEKVGELYQLRLNGDEPKDSEWAAWADRADSAARADSADSAASAAWAARAASADRADSYKKMSDKLIELIEECKGEIIFDCQEESK